MVRTLEIQMPASSLVLSSFEAILCQDDPSKTAVVSPRSRERSSWQLKWPVGHSGHFSDRS